MKKRYAIIAIIVALISPIVLSQIIRIQTGSWTIGDENAWVSFFGSYLGGVFGMIGVIFTTWVILKQNEKSLKSSLDAEDMKVREREVATFMINKSEEVATTIEEYGILVTQLVSSFINSAIAMETIESIKQRGLPAEFVYKQLDEMDELKSEFIKNRILIIEKLNQASVKSIPLGEDFQNQILHIKEMMIAEEDKMNKAIEAKTPYKQVDKMGRDLIGKVDRHAQPLHKNLSEIITNNINKMKKGIED